MLVDACELYAGLNGNADEDPPGRFVLYALALLFLVTSLVGEGAREPGREGGADGEESPWGVL